MTRITLNSFPRDLWDEMKMLAVLNHCSPSHAMAVAVTEYLKKKKESK